MIPDTHGRCEDVNNKAIDETSAFEAGMRCFGHGRPIYPITWYLVSDYLRYYNLRQSSMPTPRHNIVLPTVNTACVTPETEAMIENEGKRPDTGSTP
jgi:hypothetical protein